MPRGRPRKYAGPLQPGKRSAAVPTRRKRAAKKAVKASNSKVFNNRVSKALTNLHIIERKQKTITFVTAQTKGTGYQTTDASVPVVTHGIHVSNVFEHCKLTRGDKQDQFSGNKISEVKLNFSGVAISLPYESDTNNSTMPFEVWFVFYKNKAGVMAKGNPNGLKSYPADTKGAIKELFTSCYPWNREDYTIKGVKKFSLRAMPKAYTNGNTFENQQTSNFPIFRRFNYSLPVAKMLKYADSEDMPSNDYLSMGIYIMNGDGSDLPPAQVRCEIQGSYYFSFTDA